jgi:hypothetical protein
MKYFRPGTSFVQPTMAVPIEFYRVIERRAEAIKDLDMQHGQNHYDTNHYIHDMIENEVKRLEPWVWAEWKLKELERQAEYRKQKLDAETVSYLKNLIASKHVSNE